MTTVEKRLILFYPQSGVEEDLSAYSFLDEWQVNVASSIFELQRLVKENDTAVGLARLDRADDDTVEAIEAAIRTPRSSEWIAVVAPDWHQRIRLKQFIQDNCIDYHTLPLKEDKLLFSLGHAHGMAALKRSATPVEYHDHQMVGSSQCMLDLFRRIRKVASSSAPVLITGESGTGKELAAHAIHERSARANGPFVAVNCGALPAGLIQSELFGHEKGAFTGAVRTKIGSIEAANGGTIFLDEIGDLPLDLQVNLLRFVQEQVITRVGGRSETPVDVRILSATHVELRRAVAEGVFREDLFYRLNVLQINMPPLHERGDDIVMLARFFLEKFAHESRKNIYGFSNKATVAILNHSWPGNVRELINRVRRATVMCEQRVIAPEDLDLEHIGTHIGQLTLEEARTAAESETIRSALERNYSNVSKASQALGVSRVTLYRLMEKHHLVAAESKPEVSTRTRANRSGRATAV